MKTKRSRVSSEKLFQRKEPGAVRKPNPFETQVLKAKFSVLNRDPQSRQSIRASVKPGALRSRAIETRKRTLGKEFATQHKTNRFVDARKDGKNFRQQQQSNASRRKEMYNLSLTHRGQTLEELERFDDPVDNDDDDASDGEDGGLLDDAFTSAAHFGGGSDEEDDPSRKDRKTVIEEMIANAKRLKADKQRENDEVYEMMQKLDSSLKTLMPQVGEHLRKDSDRPKLDDYDRVMREMIFERRGAPAEKLNSEEQARTEQEKRETLERQRQERMKIEADRGPNVTQKHRSADALDDGCYAVEEDLQDNDIEAHDPGTQYDASNISKEAKNNDGDDEATDQETDDGSSGEDEDNLSDLQNGGQSSESSDEGKPEQPSIRASPPQRPLDCPRETAIQARKYEIPQFLEFPKQYEEFVELLANRSVEHGAAIVGKLVEKCNQNHPTSKANRRLLFVYLLQQLTDRFRVAKDPSLANDFKAVQLLTPHLYDLAVKDPIDTGNIFLEVIQEKYEEYRTSPRRYPALSTLVMLKLVPLLYSASDARHTIVTPMLVFVSEILTRCYVRNRRDLTRGLFLVTAVLECVEQSKRFLPAVHDFLNNVLLLALPEREPQAQKRSTFRVAPHSLAFANASRSDRNGAGSQLLAEDFMHTEVTEEFKVRVVASTVGMISTICIQLDQCVAIQTIAGNFKPHLEMLSRVSVLPEVVKRAVHTALQKVTGLVLRPCQYLVQAEKKPKVLRLLEPKIEPVYDDIRRRPKTNASVREQRKKMQQKVKRASRSAARELRLDNEYISKLQMKRRMESDRERKEKVKRIFGDATRQQGELKSLDRKAKYRT
ncbi:nucleolar protein 14 homolog [Anopheles bellator]|uniref:nucleolar protein 14 homolog n=1 Tax=Anopheles bellator TaxID=139047 RepID=UPI00264941EF|nr:nucleolar protein 14 homolog [Anopheles bellator]